jgi:spermidine synthase
LTSLLSQLQQYGLSFASILVVGFGVLVYVYRYYRSLDTFVPKNNWSGKWEVTPESLGGFSYLQLALASVLGLFLELLMIRWISSEIRMFAYFKNFVLIACFLGFGLGCYLCRRRINILMMALPLLTLVLLVTLPWAPFRELVGHLPSFLGVFSEMNFWSVGQYSFGAYTIIGVLAAITVVVLVFGLLTFVFIPLGQFVGWYLENAKKGILGYTINILGSLAGILLYTLLCFLYLPPAIWLLFAGIMFVFLLWRVPRVRFATAVVFLLCLGLAAVHPEKNATVYWSPYQELTVSPVVQSGETIAYNLKTNGDWYQKIFNLSPEFVDTHADLFKDVSPSWNAYNLPYHFYPHPNSVLVLGAGTGNDVAAALRNGAHRVVAVEIDPLILKLGKKLHFEQPYSSNQVTPVLNDARSYLQNDTEQFDLIMFSLLDSHTTSSHFTNIRIDNYVYTKEALLAARCHLRPDGLMVVKFWVAAPWIAGRLYGLMEDTFGHPPLEVAVQQPIYATAGSFYISGSPDRLQEALGDPALAQYVQAHPAGPVQKATLTTDDWPYFYQREPGLPLTVVLISAVLILLCWVFLREAGVNTGTVRWHFFFLGAGFLLLEAQIVSKMALLFGTTWVVNSIVIAGLLLLIVVSNILVDYVPRIPFAVAYACIFATIALSYFIPLEKLFFPSVATKMLAATLVLCLPVFFAGIVFIRSFAAEKFSGQALGSNLFGALVGGLLESLSYWTGIRFLLVLVALFYLASLISLRPLSSAPVKLEERVPVSSNA